MKVNEMSWFQKGSFSEMDSVPIRVLRLWFSGRSLTWLVLAPISRFHTGASFTASSPTTAGSRVTQQEASGLIRLNHKDSKGYCSS